MGDRHWGLVSTSSFPLFLFFLSPYLASLVLSFSHSPPLPSHTHPIVHERGPRTRRQVMDPQQQQPQQSLDDQSQNFVATQYMYASEDDANYLVYPQMPYQGVVQQHPGPPPRGFMQHALCLLQPRSDLTILVFTMLLSQGKCPTATCSKRCSIIAKSI